MPFSTMQSDSGNFPSLKTPDSVAHRPVKPQLPATPAQEQENLPCPRCDSTNTKFCYYNNYNLSQPRHFCKSCRRYWTKGGALRNIPIGGGSRKNKRPTPPKPSAQPAESETAIPAVFGENDGILDVTGTFGSLLASSGCFGYLGEPFANGWSLGYGKQLSSSGSLGLDGTWSLREMDESSGIGNSWQSDNSGVAVGGGGGGGGGGGEGFEGDCWVANVWPELAISAPGKGLQ